MRIPPHLPTVLMDLLLWRLSWEQPQDEETNPTCNAWRCPHHPSQARHRSTAWLKPLPGDINAVPISIAGACRAALSRQLGCGFLSFSEEEGLPMWWTAWPCHLAGRWEDGWQPAVVTGPGTALGSTGWELRSSTVSLAHQPPFHCTDL